MIELYAVKHDGLYLHDTHNEAYELTPLERASVYKNLSDAEKIIEKFAVGKVVRLELKEIEDPF